MAGISAAGWAAIAGATASVATAGYQIAQGKPKAPEAPKIPTAPAQTNAPDAGAIQKSNAAKYAGAGQESTLLTGLNGVAPGVNVAKNTLLGA